MVPPTAIVGSYRVKNCQNAIRTALDQISQERFNWVSRNFKAPWTTDMTIITASGRLQNATEHCVTVRETCSAGKQSNNSARVWRQITPNDTQCLHGDFQVEWCGVSPGPINWWASCLPLLCQIWTNFDKIWYTSSRVNYQTGVNKTVTCCHVTP